MRRRPSTRGLRSRVPRGISLLELITSLASAAVLFAGLATAVAFSIRAGDPSSGTFHNSYDAAKASLQITRELQSATGFNSAVCNSTRVEFTVPDINGDGSPDTIRYSWGGSAGNALMRTFNGGTAQTFLPDVNAFSLRYHTKTVPPTVVLTESAETLFLDQESGNTGFINSTIDVSTSYWIGEYFKPTLPSNAVSWRITRVQWNVDDTGVDDGTALVQVRAADTSGKPSLNVIGQAVLSESDLPNTWYTVTFSNASGILPTQGACVNVGTAAGTSVARLRAGFFSNGSPGTYLLTSYDDGATWSATTWIDLWIRVWGTYTSSTAGTGSNTYLRTGIDLTLQAGSSSRAAVTSSVQTVNQPEVSGP